MKVEVERLPCNKFITKSNSAAIDIHKQIPLHQQCLKQDTRHRNKVAMRQRMPYDQEFHICIHYQILIYDDQTKED
jgi:hypothetical protein